MNIHRPVDMAESNFLKHDKDLFVLGRRKIETPIITAATAGLPVLLLVPFLAFTVIASFLCRVFTIVVCSMGLWILCSMTDTRHIFTAREWIFSAGV